MRFGFIICVANIISISFAHSFRVIRAPSFKYSTIMNMKASDLEWIDLQISPQQMLPENTLTMGQCFHWKRLSLNNPLAKLWIGVVDGQPLLLKQLPDTTSVVKLSSSRLDNFKSDKDLKTIMRSYFQVEEDLLHLYSVWSQKCERMRIVTKCLQGVRVLRQDPWECLISFICSSNNNIARITLMLDRLRSQYGDHLCRVKVIPSCDPQDPDNFSIVVSTDSCERAEFDSIVGETHDLFTFPSVERLATLDESDLRSLGMGYRAKFIVDTAKFVLAQDSNWLMSLRAEKSLLSDEQTNVENRLHVQSQLMQLPGVGRKVADCVSLFSLDQTESIPVDVHVWDIAVRDFAPELKGTKSLTPTIYENVGNVFRNIFQHHSGWAHSVLFAAELPNFRVLLPESLQNEMKQFSKEKKNMKSPLSPPAVVSKKKVTRIIKEEDVNGDAEFKSSSKRRKL